MLNFEAQAVEVASGFQFMEGVAFDTAGNLYAVDGVSELVVRFEPEGDGWRRRDFCDTSSTKAGPNGSAFHRDGRLFCAGCGNGTIIELPPDGGVSTVFADRLSGSGERLKGPNDLRFRGNGDLYFTDPGQQELEAPPIGTVCWATPEGHVRTFASDLRFPNGLTFTADWSTLLVAESHTHSIWAYPIERDGSAGRRELYAKLEIQGRTEERLGIPDGITFGADGNLYAAMCGGDCVAVISPTGETLGRLELPGWCPTNLAFWGESLFVSEGTVAGLYRFELGVAGQPLFSGV